MEELEKLKGELFYKPKNSNLKFSKAQMKKVMEYCEEYKNFLNCCKTERKACSFAVKEAEKKGLKSFLKMLNIKLATRCMLLIEIKMLYWLILGKGQLKMV